MTKFSELSNGDIFEYDIPSFGKAILMKIGFGKAINLNTYIIVDHIYDDMIFVKIGRIGVVAEGKTISL